MRGSRAKQERHAEGIYPGRERRQERRDRVLEAKWDKIVNRGALVLSVIGTGTGVVFDNRCLEAFGIAGLLVFGGPYVLTKITRR